jgi:hypothetical protein
MLENNIYFTDYKVSTITCNADLGLYLNLDILYENFEMLPLVRYWINLLL